MAALSGSRIVERPPAFGKRRLLLSFAARTIKRGSRWSGWSRDFAARSPIDAGDFFAQPPSRNHVSNDRISTGRRFFWAVRRVPKKSAWLAFTRRRALGRHYNAIVENGDVAQRFGEQRQVGQLTRP